MVITWNELRDARERLGLTQEELAEKLGVSTRTITNWERVGVARKAEYKVDRFFGDALERDDSKGRLGVELEYNRTVSEMTLDDRADHEGLTTFSQVLKNASDAELLEELTRRARSRGLVAVSKEWDLPPQAQREASQILRGERSRLTREDLKIGVDSPPQKVGGPDDDVESRRQADHDLAAKKRTGKRYEENHD